MLTRRLYILCLLFCVLAVAVSLPASAAEEAVTQPQTTGKSAAAEVPPEYHLQPGDLLIVSVWREPDLQAEVLVRPDGGLSFPLAGEVQASGLSAGALSAQIAERLRKFVPDAIVTVTVKAIGGNRVYVIGRVNRPGEFTFSRPLDVMQALSMAGGATPFASLNDIRILRWSGGRQVSIPFRYGEVEKGRKLEQNIRLESGDTVVVP